MIARLAVTATSASNNTVHVLPAASAQRDFAPDLRGMTHRMPHLENLRLRGFASRSRIFEHYKA